MFAAGKCSRRPSRSCPRFLRTSFSASNLSARKLAKCCAISMGATWPPLREVEVEKVPSIHPEEK